MVNSFILSYTTTKVYATIVFQCTLSVNARKSSKSEQFIELCRQSSVSGSSSVIKSIIFT